MWPGLRVTKPLLFLTALTLLWVSAQTFAFVPDTAFWKSKAPTIRFTTTAQTILAGNCSGIVTIGTFNPAGAQTNVSSNLTINLSGAISTTFYSDDTCTNPISSFVIASGTSSGSFYYTDDSVGAVVLTASATGYASIMQSETHSTNPFIWTGAGGVPAWNTGANWSGGVAPGASDQALFNAVCTVNCSPTIGSNISVLGVRLAPGYASTITQSNGFTITVGTKGWGQLTGNFSGGNSAIGIVGSLGLAGGSFTSTSGNLTLQSHLYMLAGGGFTHNSGTLIFWSNNSSHNLVINSAMAMNQLKFSGNGYNTIINVSGSSNITVNGAFTCDPNSSPTLVNTGTIIMKGDVSFADRGCSGSGLLRVAGNSNQTISGANTSVIPSMDINSTGGTVLLSGTVQFVRDFTYTAGTISAGTSNVIFNFYASSNQSINLAAPLDLYNVQFTGYGYSTTRTLTGTMNVNGLFVCNPDSGAGAINGGSIVAKGDLSFSDRGCTGTATITIGGSGNQTLTGTNTAVIQSLDINSTGGIVTFAGTPQFIKNFTYTAGTFNAGTSNIWFNFNGTAHTLNLAAPLDFNDVSFVGEGWTASWTISGTMTVNGTLACPASPNYGTINGSPIYAKGNVSFSNNGCTGTSVIMIAGSGNQTVTGASGANIPTFEINSTGGTVTLSGTLKFTRNFTYTAGTIDAGTSLVQFDIASGNYSINLVSPLTLNHVEFITSGWNFNRTLSGTLNVNGTLTCDPNTYSGALLSGTINAYGNVVFGGYGCTGTTVLNYEGASSTTISKASTASTFGSLSTINKTGGAKVTLVSDLPLGTNANVTVNNGTLDLGGYNLAVTSALAVGASGTLKCNGGIFSYGSLTNNGTINCPGYSTYDFNWTGAAADSNWSTAGNWQGGVVPGVGDVPYFTNAYCGANCNANLSGNINIRGLHMISPFTGTIAQGTANTISVGIRGWTQTAGTFTGGDGNVTMNFLSNTGAFSVTGGTYMATSGTMTVGHTSGISGGVASRTTFQVGSAATFNSHNGTVQINCGETVNGTQVCYIDAPSGISFNHLITSANGGYGNGVGINTGQTGTVFGNLTVLSGILSGGGAWDLYGNLNTSTTFGGQSYGVPAIVTLKGGGNQTYSTAGNRPTVYLVVNKPSGTVTPASTDARFAKLVVTAGTFTAPTGTLYLGQYTNGSTTGNMTLFSLPAPANFVDQGGTVDFCAYDTNSGNAQYTLQPNGTLTLTNAKITGHPALSSSQNVTAGDKIVVTGTFTKVTGRMGGAWELQGNAVLGGIDQGTASLTFTGTANQSVSGSVSPTGTWTINKPSGTVSLANALNLNGAAQALTITSGTLNMAGYNLTVAGAVTNNGVLKRGDSPACGTLTNGSFTGTPAICP